MSPHRAASGTSGIGGLPPTLVVAAFVLTAIAITVVMLARPWELRGGRFADKLRIADAVSSYDFWLALRGVGVRRRRELRAELRANLWEATQRVGGKQALAAVGSLRALAADSVAERRRPRWGFGLAAGLVAVEVFVMFQIFLATVVADTAQASGVSRVEVPVSAVPGMRAVYETLPNGGFSSETAFGPACLVVGALVFLVVARPWTLLVRRAAVPA